MKSSASPTFPAFRPEDLLGPLNVVEAHHAPEQLFVAGAIGLLKLGTRVSIVGSRQASDLGLRRARKLARELAEQGVVIVSGLAKGIDTAAHRAAIDAGGKTVAVLGTPLDRTYPAENRALQALIMDEHLAVSQYPIGYPVRPGNFPRRNRTMALLSNATVIVEAGETSGSLSQGWEALRLGRNLFVLESVAEDKSLKWPQEMISYGAEVLSSTEQLLEALPMDVGGSLASLTF